MANKSIVVYGGTLAGTTGLPISWMPINLNKNYFVTHGYTYRLKTVATVYNSNGGVVETATKYSSSVNF